MTSAQRARRHRARQKADASSLLIPSVVASDQSAPPPGDDLAERQGAIKTCDELIEEFKTVAATLMPPAPEGEDAKARL